MRSIYFHLDGFINRQNCLIWDSENPEMILEKQMNDIRTIAIRCALWSRGIIEPFFFEKEPLY